MSEKITVEKHAGSAGVVIRTNPDNSREQEVVIDHTPAHSKVIIDRERKDEDA